MTEVRTAAAAQVGPGPITLIVIAMAAFSLQDVVVKVVADQVALWQLQFIRSLLTLWLLVMAAAAMGWLALLAPGRWSWPLVRSLFMCAAYLLFYASLPLLPLSTAGAAFFTGPLFIALLAALVLGEPIGPRRLAALGLGFAGVLCIVRPGLAGWQPVALLPVLSALCYAAGIVITRSHCRDESSFALTMVHNLLYAAIGLAGVVVLRLAPVEAVTQAHWPFVLSGWMPLGALAAALILGTAATHLIGVLCSVRAYQTEESSRIAPFEYSYLAMMVVYDVALWGYWPDLLTLFGMLLISCAGIFVAWRTGHPARPQVHPRSEEAWVADEMHGDRAKSE